LLRPAGLVVASVAVVALTVGPWVAYNMSRFRKPVLVSTNFDLNLLMTNCPDTFHGPLLGSSGLCSLWRTPSGRDESVVAVKERSEALTYLRANLSAYPVAVLARIGRTFSLYKPLDDPKYGVFEGRPKWVTDLGLIAYYPLLVLAAWAVRVRRRARALLWPLLVPFGIVLISMLVSYGQVRYRVSCEPVIVVLGAIGLVAITRGRTATDAVSAPEPVTTSPR
ncbi:MAG TPA: hypothetical protein VMH39_11395, partial [Gemmatimonadaceae bacterium]|nr:hypothetical protein [Gemmatimonadaceae bacterium]